MSSSTHRIIQFLLFALPLTGASPAAPIPAPGAKPADVPSKSTLKTFVTITTEGGSTYTLTYVPSTITQDTTITEASTTSTVNAGAIIGALAGGAVLAALPAIIPKILPRDTVEVPKGGDGGGDDDNDNNQCDKKTASVCTDECTASWFISECSVITTPSCSSKACSSTVGCNVQASTTTVSATPSPTQYDVYEGNLDDFISNPADAPPFDVTVIQAYLGKEYQRLHIDSDGTSGPDPDAQCEKDPAKGSLQVNGVQVSHLPAAFFLA